MASRADRTPAARRQPELPLAPRLGGAIRAAGVDFYFQSIRLVLANAVWGICLLVVLGIGSFVSPLLGLLLSPLLAIPAVGVFRLAALIVRGEPPDFSDVTAAWRRYGGLALVLGVGFMLAGVVLVVDLFGAVGSSSPIAWAIATLAAWGLLALITYALLAWPIMVDPRREAESLPHRLRLAGLLLAAFPGRMALLGLMIAVILFASTIAFAALLSVSVAYVGLVACRYVLPAADRLEARLSRVAPSGEPPQDVRE